MYSCYIFANLIYNLVISAISFLTMDEPALDSDGSLKDAKDMAWDHSPTQEAPPPAEVPSSPTPAPHKKKTIFTFTMKPNLTPANFTNPKRKADSLKTASASTGVNQSTTGSICQNRKDGTVPMAKLKAPAKKAMIDRICTDTELHEAKDDGSDVELPKRCKRGDGAADILTVFRAANTEDGAEGHVCEIWA
jgi:hypothetical protein